MSLHTITSNKSRDYEKYADLLSTLIKKETKCIAQNHLKEKVQFRHYLKKRLPE